MTSFYDLAAFRSQGEMTQPLSMTDIKAYTDLLNLKTVDAGFRFLKVIKALDAIYLNHKKADTTTEIKQS